MRQKTIVSSGRDRRACRRRALVRRRCRACNSNAPPEVLHRVERIHCSESGAPCLRPGRAFRVVKPQRPFVLERMLLTGLWIRAARHRFLGRFARRRCCCLGCLVRHDRYDKCYERCKTARADICTRAMLTAYFPFLSSCCFFLFCSCSFFFCSAAATLRRCCSSAEPGAPSCLKPKLNAPIKTITAARRNEGLPPPEATLPSSSCACAASLEARAASELDVRKRLLFEPERGVRGVL